MPSAQFARDGYLGPVTDLLGDDLVLWGASAVRRVPGQTHPWHCDIESCAPEGGFVTVRGGKNLARPAWHLVKPYLPKRG